MTRASVKKCPEKHVSFSNSTRALLFSLYKEVKSTVKPHKLATTLVQEYRKRHGKTLGKKSVRGWVRKWNENNGEFTLENFRPKSYLSKRKRVGEQISAKLKEGRSARGITFDEFQDDEGKCTVSPATVIRAGESNFNCIF